MTNIRFFFLSIKEKRSHYGAPCQGGHLEALVGCVSEDPPGLCTGPRRLGGKRSFPSSCVGLLSRGPIDGAHWAREHRWEPGMGNTPDPRPGWTTVLCWAGFPFVGATRTLGARAPGPDGAPGPRGTEPPPRYGETGNGDLLTSQCGLKHQYNTRGVDRTQIIGSYYPIGGGYFFSALCLCV
jgi:hypothetical protein